MCRDSESQDLQRQPITGGRWSPNHFQRHNLSRRIQSTQHLLVLLCIVIELTEWHCCLKLSDGLHSYPQWAGNGKVQNLHVHWD